LQHEYQAATGKKVRDFIDLEFDTKRFPPESAEHIELKAGHLELHDDFTIHMSAPNLSNRRRAALSAHFIRPEARFRYDEWPNWRVRMARGTDRFGHHRTWDAFQDFPVPE
jgi:hypothetical protein